MTCVVRQSRHSFLRTMSLYARKTDEDMAREAAKRVRPPGGTEGGSDIVAEEDVGVEQHPQEGVGNVQGASLLDQSEVAEHPPLRQGEGGAAAGPERLDVAEGSILSEELLAHVLGLLARVLDVLDVQGVERQDYTEEGRRRRSRQWWWPEDVVNARTS